jgi:hypothetical protein
MSWEKLCPLLSRLWVKKFEGIKTSVYYMNATVEGPVDDEGVWTDDALAFNGNILNYAFNATKGLAFDDENRIRGIGHSGPANKSNFPVINGVRFRIYGSITGTGDLTMFGGIVVDALALVGTSRITSDTPDWGDWVEVTPSPSLDWEWDWDKVYNSKIKMFAAGSGTLTEVRVYAIELEVSYSQGPIIGD